MRSRWLFAKSHVLPAFANPFAKRPANTVGSGRCCGGCAVSGLSIPGRSPAALGGFLFPGDGPDAASNTAERQEHSMRKAADLRAEPPDNRKIVSAPHRFDPDGRDR